MAMLMEEVDELSCAQTKPRNQLFIVCDVFNYVMSKCVNI